MCWEIDVDGFCELVKCIEQFFVCSGENVGQLFLQFNDILLVQDYQDLIGQVIKCVIKLVIEVESNFVKLVWMVGQVDCYVGIEYDYVSMCYQVVLECLVKGEGLQVVVEK